ncbi:MarR family winged helix-turn-helix transcriptional regulator [Acidovorax sp. BL-A-41-H1]|uniref:MarR family winged helix-turn-helix transcriptional regulator n=1 Tax=Acidovorax sp. BL-A-41-H1 TaxID=3421102 RepID=UPI003F79040F
MNPNADPEPAGFYCASHLEPPNSVGYLMRQVMSSIRTQADTRLSTHDLTYAQWLPLYKISRSAGVTVAELARESDADPASMTRALDRLEAKGLVLRERSTTDRRVVQLTLTAEGQAVAAQVPQVLADVLNGHLSDFTHDEWQQLLALLRRMVVNGEALRQQDPQAAPSAPPTAARPGRGAT